MYITVGFGFLEVPFRTIVYKTTECELRSPFVVVREHSVGARQDADAGARRGHAQADGDNQVRFHNVKSSCHYVTKSKRFPVEFVSIPLNSHTLQEDLQNWGHQGILPGAWHDHRQGRAGRRRLLHLV